MTRRTLIHLALLLAVLWLAPLTSHAAGDTPVNSYTLTPLGSLGGTAGAYGVNDSAQVVGVAYIGANQYRRAFLWQAGAMTDLGTLGGAESWAFGINSSGRVAGWAMNPAGAPRAFLWDAAGMRDLGTLGGASSYAYGINDAGQVVGASYRADLTSRAFLWQNGRMLDLGTFAPYPNSYALRINAVGQVVGYTWDGSGNGRYFVWTPNGPNGTIGTTVTLPAGGVASDVNASGAVVGWTSALEGYESPVLWDGAGPHSLPLLSGAVGGMALGINDSECVVGENSSVYSGEWEVWTYEAFIWDRLNGTRWLQGLTGETAHLDEARAISAGGLIAANDWHGVCAYLLTPSPLPIRPRLWTYPAVEDGRVSLSWTACNGAASYNVKRAASSGGPYVPLVSGVTGTSYSDTAVINGSRYYYVVSAVNAYGESANSNETVGGPVQAPDPPTGLTAVPGDQEVTLAWNASARADYYKVQRSTSPGGPYSWFDNTTDTRYLDRGDWDEWGSYPLNNGTRYYYVVTAVNMPGESGYSNEASATPAAPPPPPAPTGLTATVVGPGQVSLTWNASPGATMYWVRRGTASGGPYATITNEYSTSFHENNLQNGTTYYYVVSAVNSGGESPNSSEVSVTPTGPPPPAAPTSLTATAGKKRVTLQWRQSASSGVTQNRIYRATTSGGPYALRATISAGTSYADTSVTSGVTYYYVVTALNSTGKESAYSSQAFAKPK